MEVAVDLLVDRRNDVRMPCARVLAADPAGEVEVASTVRVLHPHALGPGDGDRGDRDATRDVPVTQLEEPLVGSSFLKRHEVESSHEPTGRRWTRRLRGTLLVGQRVRISPMEISARNQLPGTVKSVTLGTVMAEVVVDVAGHELVSAITRRSAESLSLAEGDSITVVIKATEVILGK